MFRPFWTVKNIVAKKTNKKHPYQSFFSVIWVWTPPAPVSICEERVEGGGGGEYYNIFIHTWARTILGLKIFNFNTFEGFQKNEYFWGMKILWISFGHQKVNPKKCLGLRMYENIRVPLPPPLPLSHPGASMLGIREQYQRTSYFVFGVTTQIAKIRWAHVGSWWKCGRRRIPTLYQHRTNATMSTILSLLNIHYIITKSSVPVFWIMCLVLKEVYVSGAHDIGPALRRRFVWFDSYVPSTIFQLCRDESSWVEPVLSYD